MAWWEQPNPWTDWLGNRTKDIADAQAAHEERVRSMGPTNTVVLAAALGQTVAPAR